MFANATADVNAWPTPAPGDGPERLDRLRAAAGEWPLHWNYRDRSALFAGTVGPRMASPCFYSPAFVDTLNASERAGVRAYSCIRRFSITRVAKTAMGNAGIWPAIMPSTAYSLMLVLRPERAERIYNLIEEQGTAPSELLASGEALH
jgi:hypothetical protein